MVNERILEETPAPDMTNAPLEPWVLRELPSNPPRHEWQHHRLKRRVRFTDIYSQVRRDQRLLEEMDRRRAAKKGHRRDAYEPPTAQEWLLEQFESFLSQVREKLEIAPPEEQVEEPVPQPRIRPMRPTRSSGPILNVKPAELLRPEFSRGRLYFSCPSCRFPTVLPVWLAGKNARCPRCYCALRAPHPRRGLKARILENDIESVLHPESFTQYYKAHRLIPWLGIPRPKLHPAFHGLSVAVLVMLLGFWIPSLLKRAAHQMERMAAVAQRGHMEEGPGFKDRARTLVENFLAAENISAKSAYVRDPDRVTTLMCDWYRRHPGGGTVTPRVIEVSGAGFYSGDQQHPVTDVRVELPGGETNYYTVEHLPEGDRIEWESSVGYTADFDSIMSRGAAGGPQPVRVMAALDDYYNFAFRDAATHVCLRLHDPSTLEFLGYGYVPVEQATPFLTYLDGSSVEDLRPLTLEVQPADQDASRRQVLVRRLLQNGWRMGTPTAGALLQDPPAPGKPGI